MITKCMGGCLRKFLVLSLLLTLSGCAATVDQKITLGYSPVEKPFSRASGDIVITKPEGKVGTRNDKGEWIVGSLNNVHGVHLADILADRAVADWIVDALVLELKKTGFNVTVSPQPASGQSLGLSLSELLLFMNVNIGTVTDETVQELKFNLDVFREGNRIKTVTIGTREKNELRSANKEAKEKMMLNSLQDAMQKIVPDIISISVKK